MHRARIRKGKNGEFENSNLYIACEGFKQLGFEVETFSDVKELLGNLTDDIVVSGIGDVRKILTALGKTYPELNYPDSLRELLGRKVWQSKLSDILTKSDSWGVFIKPAEGIKTFTGTVINNINDLRACYGVDPYTKIWCSDIVNFVSEWRCFIRYKNVIGVKHYNGNWTKAINFDMLEKAIDKFTDQPAAYVLDFGVTDRRETLLVEVNEGYSVGSYGLDSITYAKFLSARWAELTNTEDVCK